MRCSITAPSPLTDHTQQTADQIHNTFIQEEAEDLGSEHFIMDLRKIQTSGTHLLGLINDVLDLSKIESGKMDLHHANMAGRV